MNTQEKETQIFETTHLENSAKCSAGTGRATEIVQRNLWRVVNAAAVSLVFAFILLGAATSVSAVAKPAIAPVTTALHMSPKRSYKTKKIKQRKIKKAGHKAGRQKKGKHHR